MKDKVIISFGIIVLMMFSCQSTESPSDTNAEGVQLASGSSCETQTKATFNHFLNLEYGDQEQLLSNRLGKMTSGAYAGDSSLFIYHYARVPRVPIQIWVDAVTNKVKTIFIEVLSLEENFKQDLQTAIDEYDIQECEAYWFGRTADEIIEQLGTPTSEGVTKEFVNEITYLSDNEKYMVAFKVYPEQNNQCSSIAVTWFY